MRFQLRMSRISFAAKHTQVTWWALEQWKRRKNYQMIIASTSVTREKENEKQIPLSKKISHLFCIKTVLRLTLEQISYSYYMESVASLLSFGGKQIQTTN